MPVIIRVRVQAISPDRLSLTLQSGEQISIPRSENDRMDRFAVGDEMTMTLTRSTDLLNELLRNSEDNEDEDKKNRSQGAENSKA